MEPRSHPMQHRDGGVWDCSSRRWSGEHYKIAGIAQRNAGEIGPVRLLRRSAAAHRVDRLGLNNTLGKIRLMRKCGVISCANPFPSMKCIWNRGCKPSNESLSYRELADRLVTYVRDLGYTIWN
jgi:hypothetical protein